jgi:fatty acid desaturase
MQSVTTRQPGTAAALLATPRFHRFVFALAGDWLVVVLVMVLARRVNHLWAYALAVFIVGTRQQAIGILGHDGAHKLASRRRGLNDAVTQLFCFWPISMEMSGFKAFHFPHHRFANTPNDPEIRYREQDNPEWDVPCSLRRIAFRFLKDLLGLATFKSIRAMYSARRANYRDYLGAAVTLLAAIIITSFTGTIWILALWFVAFFTSFAAVSRLRCWLEHLGTYSTHRVYVPRWLSWFVAPHNIFFHWEHHKWPAIPYWNLSRARKLDSSVPVMSIWELFRFYSGCPPVKSGTPTLDEFGFPL